VLVLGLARGANDAGRVGRVGLPEHRLRNLAALGDDLVGETESLKGLDAALLDAVGLPDFQTARAPLDDARGDTGKLRELRRRIIPAGPAPTISTSTFPGICAGRSMPTPAAGWMRGSPET